MTGGVGLVGVAPVESFPMKRKIHRILSRSGVLQLWLLGVHLRQVGWLRSARSGCALAPDGSPLPWFTYSAIHFLQTRLPPGLRVFEWGSGGSTHWWSQRAREVVACEHDHDWFLRVAEKAPQNTTVVERPRGIEYLAEIESRGLFDVVVIDGRDRVACVVHAIPQLSQQGIIVWDNSDRAKYQPGFDTLSEAGFRRVEFYGLGPSGSQPWGTSIFYRTANCLGL